MRWLAKAAGPFVRLLSACTVGVLKLLRVNTNNARAVTEEEITASLEEGVDAGLIEAHEHQMVRNVFHLDDRPLTSLMVPRSDIDWLNAAHSIAQALDSVLAAGPDGPKPTHSWYPVCRGGLDDVVGVVSLGQLLALRDKAGEPVELHAQPATFVPETLSGMELLEQFRALPLPEPVKPVSGPRAARTRLLFVVDEYGVVQGLLTPLDLLEAITGELQPGASADAWALPQPDGSWLIEGLMPVSELKARLDIAELPLEDRGRYNTVAGLLMAVSGRLPGQGEQIECAGWRFEVVQLEGRRIDKVSAVFLKAAD
jgi:putative hemolysin